MNPKTKPKSSESLWLVAFTKGLQGFYAGGCIRF